jgi:hypothetical protein
MGRASACLLEVSATTFVLVALVVEAACIVKERCQLMTARYLPAFKSKLRTTRFFVVNDVLGRFSGLFERLIKEFVVVLGNVKFDLDVPNNFHTSE